MERISEIARTYSNTLKHRLLSLAPNAVLSERTIPEGVIYRTNRTVRAANAVHQLGLVSTTLCYACYGITQLFQHPVYQYSS